MSTETSAMTAEQIVADATRYTLFDWHVQSKASPLAIDRAEGVYMYGVDGRRWLDFSSQLMGVNIGHGDKRVTEAITRQAEKLPYISPFHAFEGRAVLGKRLAGLWPGDIEKTFFTLGGAEANENAVKMAKAVTGRQKVLARYRSYHGSTYATMALTGDPRRWPNEAPPMPGVVHVLDPYHGTKRGFDDAETALELLEETIELEGPETIAAFILEPVTGTNGILIPPDGYLQGRARALHEARDPADRRRGDVRLGPHRRVVRGRQLGRRARPDHDRQGADVLLRAARRRRPRAAHRGVLRRPHVLGRADVQHPPARRRGRDRGDRRVGAGRPDRQRQAARTRDAPPPRGARGEASERRPHPQHRAVRHHRARQEPRDDGAAVAVQHR